jgi:predicted outer membrane protein
VDGEGVRVGAGNVKADIARGGASADQQIAALLYNCCKKDIELSKFAQDRLQNEEVRQFAEKMITEHTAACEKLAKFAGPAAGGDPRLEAVPGEPRPARPARVEGRTEAREEAREERREGREGAREERREGDAPEAREERREGREEAREERREAAPRADAPRTAESPRPIARALEGAEAEVQLRAGGDRPRPEVDVRLGRTGAAGGLNWVSIFKEIGDQQLASAKQEFSAKEGAELDKCYLGGQIMGHMKAIDEIKVLRKYCSAEFRQELDSCVEECKAHLEEAKTLAKKLEASSTPRVSLKPELKDTPAPKPEE